MNQARVFARPRSGHHAKPVSHFVLSHASVFLRRDCNSCLLRQPCRSDAATADSSHRFGPGQSSHNHPREFLDACGYRHQCDSGGDLRQQRQQPVCSSIEMGHFAKVESLRHLTHSQLGGSLFRTLSRRRVLGIPADDLRIVSTLCPVCDSIPRRGRGQGDSDWTQRTLY